MVDRVYLSASDENLEACIHLATEHGLGIELTAFCQPALLDGTWRVTLERYRLLLRPVTGGMTMHGPFFDMAPGSIDEQVNKLTYARYRQAIQIAAEVGASLVVFHANFIASIRSDEYRRGWQERNLAFWAHLADEAQAHGVHVAIENMWEFDPDIIGDILHQINHPRLHACLDVGHVYLYSHVPLARWTERLADDIVHIHINNTPGNLLDTHDTLQDGIINYAALLPHLRSLPKRPSFTLEMERVEQMQSSLSLMALK